ncbi:hypothetical protein TNCV_1693971 [Trichonephila clavipes]|nr:hypothetical protein TNCV_1693971 [Trichonephila clavipes]
MCPLASLLKVVSTTLSALMERAPHGACLLYQGESEELKKRKCGTAPEVRRPGAPEGRGLIWLLHLQALAEQNGVAFTPWVALPGVDTPDVHRPLRLELEDG